jgi:hypothetical protein
MGIVAVRIFSSSTRRIPSSVQTKTEDFSVGVAEGKSETSVFGERVPFFGLEVGGVFGEGVPVGMDGVRVGRGPPGSVGAKVVALGCPLPDEGPG